MKSKILFPIITLLIVAGTIITISSCSDMFKNPLEDKDTGEDITLLIVDMNFIETHVIIYLEDFATGELIENEELDVEFTGESVSNIITFTGEKPDVFTTEIGILEVGCDPNYKVSKTNPFEFTISASNDNYISIPTFVSYTVDGKKNVVLKLINIGNQFKSTGTGFDEPFDLVSDPAGSLYFWGDVRSVPTGTGYQYLNMYYSSPASIISENISDPILYPDYGMYTFSHTPPNIPLKSIVATGDGLYLCTTVLRSNLEKCPEGLTINISEVNGNVGTGQFGYEITFSDGYVQSGLLTSTFPSTHLIEQIYYPVDDKSFKIEIFGDAQYTMSPAQNRIDPCGSVDFVATPIDGLRYYKFVTRYKCPDTAVSFALSIQGQYRLKGTQNSWTTFSFDEGTCYLWLMNNQEYDFRASFDSEWTTYSLPTNPADIDTYVRGNQSDDFSVNSLVITDTPALITVNADLTLGGEVCEALNKI